MISQSDEVKNFYYEKMVPESDMVFRFAYFLCLSSPLSYTICRDVYKGIIDQLETLRTAPFQASRMALLQRAWKLIQSTPQSDAKIGGVLQSLTTGLKTQARAVLFLKDYAGYSNQEAAQILGVSEDVVRDEISEARSLLVNQLGKN